MDRPSIEIQASLASAPAAGPVESEVLDLYERFYRNIYAYCLRRLFLADLAEDATSAVFLRLVEKFDQFRGQDRGRVCRWLYGTAANVAASLIREKKRRAKIFQELTRATSGAESSLHHKAMGKLDWPRLYAAIFELKQPQQDMIILRYFEGFDTNEIAEILNLKPVTARVTLSRAIRRLRKNLEVSLGDA